MAFVKADQLIARLHAAGLVDEYAQRVVIDLKHGDLAVIHVRSVGDDRLLDVVEIFDGAQVVTDG